MFVDSTLIAGPCVVVMVIDLTNTPFSDAGLWLFKLLKNVCTFWLSLSLPNETLPMPR